MATSRSGKSKSSGLRILWIPGGRKSHSHKGRFDSTNKTVSYSPKQKKSENWSLGGSKAQKDLLNAEPDNALLDGPSGSGFKPVACALGASASSRVCAVSIDTETNVDENKTANQNSPVTPSSTTSTALLVSLPTSPEPADDINTMPAKSSHLLPLPTITTTTAEIIDENRFSILSKDSGDFLADLPLPPRDNSHLMKTDSIHSSTNTASTTAASTPSKTNNEFDSTTGKKSHHHNHNNNLNDINSIESISESTQIPDVSSLDWINDIDKREHGNEKLEVVIPEKHKSKKKKKKSKRQTKELDQLDGVPTKFDGTVSNKNENSENNDEDDEAVVKCLYYTLMCCECTIS